MNRRALLLTALLAVACARDDGGSADVGASERWRGDVSFPGLPHIGVVVDVGEGRARMVAAANMGFGSADLIGFTQRDDVVSFEWTIDEVQRSCVLTRADEAGFLGPCTAFAEPPIGFLLVPPGSDAPTGLARTLLEMSSVRWATLSDDAITRVRAAAADSARVDVGAVADAIADARRRNAELFAEQANEQRVDLFLVDDRQQMRQLVGFAAGGWTDPMAGTVVMTGFGAPRISLMHEVTHAISFNAWGPPHEGAAWLREGLATWIAGECRGYALHDLARDMRTRGELIPLRALLDDFAAHSDLVTYLQSASVVGYLLETGGADDFRRVWTAGEDGLRAMDLDVIVLEREWLRFLDERPIPARIDWAGIRSNGCG